MITSFSRLALDRRHPLASLCIGTLAVISALCWPSSSLAQRQPSLRDALLVEASDSVREGRYEWAESTLRTVIRQNDSDWEAQALLVIAVAGRGDVEGARGLTASLRARAVPDEVIRILTSAISGFESAGRLRATFISAVQVADVRAAWAALASSGLDQRQTAVASALLCVLTGDRACFESRRLLVGGDAAAGRIMNELDAHLRRAEEHGRAYGLALASLAGANELLVGDDSLVIAERAASGQCPSMPRAAWSASDARRKMEPVLRCRRELMGRLAQLGTALVELAPLSRSGLQAAVTVAILSESEASLDSAVERMRRALAMSEFPVWQQSRSESRDAFGLEERSMSYVLQITDAEVLLLQGSFDQPKLVPLLAAPDVAAGTGTPAASAPVPDDRHAVLWRVPRGLLRGSKSALRQEIEWDGRDPMPRHLERDRHAMRLTPGAAKFDVPYPAGLYQLAHAYGDIPARAGLRSFGKAVGREIGLEDRQIKLVDSIQTVGRFKTAFLSTMAVASVVTRDATSLAQVTQMAQEAQAEVDASIAARSSWVRLTEDNQVLQQVFDMTVRQQWVAQVMDLLPRLGKSGGH